MNLHVKSYRQVSCNCKMKTVKKLVQSRLEELQNMRRLLSSESRVHFLKKDGVLEWIVGEPSFVNSLTKEKENSWGGKLIGSSTVQWTTTLGENILYELLIIQNKNPQRVKKGKVGANNKRLMPDFEADDGIYENKARTYTTTGTAGEKILGTPIKYSECYRLFGKPLYIVCMGYQEKEADQSFQVFQPKSNELQRIMNFYETEMKIKYIKASDLLYDWYKNSNEKELV